MTVAHGLAIAALLMPTAVTARPAAAPALIDYANPLMGTDSSRELSVGNTNPRSSCPGA